MRELDHPTFAVLLAGGTGTRLWPVSRELFPKQLIKFIGGDSLVQNTVKRLLPKLAADKIRIVCGYEHFHETARHLTEIGVAAEGKIITEPCGRNTAPAILLAVLTILRAQDDAVLAVFPADHVIKDTEGFHRQLGAALRLASRGFIVTFGIRPHYPETGYGYIEGAGELAEGALQIKRFVEKPDATTAQAYVAAGNYFWNSGMFAFRASVMRDEFRRFHPTLVETMSGIVARGGDPAREDYARLPDISIDVAIMENTRRGVVLPSDFGWSDIGSWKSLYDFLAKDENGNVIDGDVLTVDTANCFLMGRERLIATNRLRNLVVVETPDSVFVSDMDHSRDVKTIVTRLKEQGRNEHHTHRTVYHPWGNRTLLERRADYCVERLVLYPGSRLAIEAGECASRQLNVVQGTAEITGSRYDGALGPGGGLQLSANETATVCNRRDDALMLIEVQTGLSAA